MNDETHQILLTKGDLYAHGSLFALLYLGVNMSSFIQKPEWYTGKLRMYDETHQIQIALITKCGLYIHGSLFTLFSLSSNISRYIQKPEWYTHKTRMYDITHQIQLAFVTKCSLYTHGALFQHGVCKFGPF